MKDIAYLSQPQISVRYIRTLKVAHNHPFGALAELIDNSIDASANEIDIEYYKNGRDFARAFGTAAGFSEKDCRERIVGPGKPCFPVLSIVDNGHGVDFENVKKLYSLGFSGKEGDEQIGQYGQGFQTGCLYLANDVLLVSRAGNQITCLLFSETLLTIMKSDHIVVPLLFCEVNPDGEENWFMEEKPENSEKLRSQALFALLEQLIQCGVVDLDKASESATVQIDDSDPSAKFWRRVAEENPDNQELLYRRGVAWSKFIHSLLPKSNGTRILLFTPCDSIRPNSFKDPFSCQQVKDLQYIGTDNQVHRIDRSNRIPKTADVPEDYSLRRYLQILYWPRKGALPVFTIQGERVPPIDLAKELRPTVYAFDESDADTATGNVIRVKGTIGRVPKKWGTGYKQSKDGLTGLNGCFVYINGRLIQLYKAYGLFSATNDLGKEVFAVVHLEGLQPKPHKQDLAIGTEEARRLEDLLKRVLSKYHYEIQEETTAGIKNEQRKAAVLRAIKRRAAEEKEAEETETRRAPSRSVSHSPGRPVAANTATLTVEENARWKRKETLIRKCHKHFKRIVKIGSDRAESCYFIDDPNKSIPTYSSVISKPMYFLKMDEKIRENAYEPSLKGLNDLMEDAKLIVDNAIKYNGEKAPFADFARSFYERMEKALPSVKQAIVSAQKDYESGLQNDLAKIQEGTESQKTTPERTKTPKGKTFKSAEKTQTKAATPLSGPLQKRRRLEDETDEEEAQAEVEGNETDELHSAEETSEEEVGDENEEVGETADDIARRDTRKKRRISYKETVESSHRRKRIAAPSTSIQNGSAAQSETSRAVEKGNAELQKELSQLKAQLETEERKYQDAQKEIDELRRELEESKRASVREKAIKEPPMSEVTREAPAVLNGEGDEKAVAQNASEVAALKGELESLKERDQRLVQRIRNFFMS